MHAGCTLEDGRHAWSRVSTLRNQLEEHLFSSKALGRTTRRNPRWGLGSKNVLRPKKKTKKTACFVRVSKTLHALTSSSVSRRRLIFLFVRPQHTFAIVIRSQRNVVCHFDASEGLPFRPPSRSLRHVCMSEPAHTLGQALQSHPTLPAL